jgi:hypothetical protein
MFHIIFYVFSRGGGGGGVNKNKKYMAGGRKV